MFPEYFGDKLAFSKVSLMGLAGRLRISWHYFIALLPAILIGCSLYFVYSYHNLLLDSIRELRNSADLYGDLPFKKILESTEPDKVPNSSLTMIYYLCIFLAAESSFILMAIKEYLQDLTGLSEMDLIIPRDQKDEKLAETFKSVFKQSEDPNQDNTS